MREFPMTRFSKLFIAAAVIGGVTAPVIAQTPYPYSQQPPYPQPAPGQPGYGYYPPQHGYGQSGDVYGYQGQENLGAVIGQLLGNRYNVTDRTAVQQCASAAMNQASARYRSQSSYGQPHGNAYGYDNRGYNPMMRVTAITNVERRQNGLRVSGLLDSRNGYRPNGQAYGYQNDGYAATGDLSFRCNVDYRGAVTNVRINRANTYRG